MSTNTVKMVHEADVQRQHVRVQLPAQIEVDGKTYQALDWSTGGVAINLDKQKCPFKDGQKCEGNLLFDFDGFCLTIPMKLVACHLGDDNTKRGFRFVEINQQQTAIMQQLVSSYITGELISVGDLINVVSRNNMVRARNIPDPNKDLSSAQKLKRKFSRFFRIGTIALISLLLIGYIAISLYNKAYIVSASSAIVGADSIIVESPASGKIFYKNLNIGDEVKQGRLLLAISSDGGKLFSADSPCDCVVKKISANEGEAVSKGQAVIELVKEQSRLFIKAKVDYKQATKLSTGGVAHLNLLGDVYSSGIIKSILMSDESQDQALLIIQPQDTLPKNLIGSPVEVKIDVLGWTNK